MANTSHHLRSLAAAGLVRTRRQGTRVIYGLAGERVGQLWAAVRDVAAKQMPGLGLRIPQHRQQPAPDTVPLHPETPGNNSSNKITARVKAEGPLCEPSMPRSRRSAGEGLTPPCSCPWPNATRSRRPPTTFFVLRPTGGDCWKAFDRPVTVGTTTSTGSAPTATSSRSPCIAIRPLSWPFVVGPTGIEPVTRGLKVRCSAN